MQREVLEERLPRLISAGASIMVADILEEEGRETANAIGAEFVELDLAVPERWTYVWKRQGGIWWSGWFGK